MSQNSTRNRLEPKTMKINQTQTRTAAKKKQKLTLSETKKYSAAGKNGYPDPMHDSNIKYHLRVIMLTRHTHTHNIFLTLYVMNVLMNFAFLILKYN